MARGPARQYRADVRDGELSIDGATLEEVKQRVTARLAPVHEKAFSAYADYRPWRAGLLGNIERTFAMVS